MEDCSELLDRIRLINKEAKKAKKSMICEQVEVVVAAASTIKLKNETCVSKFQKIEKCSKVYALY